MVEKYSDPAQPAATPRCPNCDAELPADASENLCPRCLLRYGLQGFTNAETVRRGSRSPHPQPAGATGPSPPPHGTPGFRPPDAHELASLFPRLEIEELLGHGGMGVVYKAKQIGLQRTVALKILPREIGQDPEFAERFAREARAMAGLSHRGIVQYPPDPRTNTLVHL